MSECLGTRSSRRIAFWSTLVGLAALLALAALPSSASASCPEPSAPTTFSTSWIGGDGHYNTDANWTNGQPSGACDASITAPGNYTVTMNAGSNTKSMTIGGAGSTPTLRISSENANTNLLVTTTNLSIASGAGITLVCNVPPESCGAPNVSAPTISNAGTFTVDASVNGMPFISGAFTNTGTMQFNHAAKFNNGAVVNQGTVNIADGTVLASGGSSCGDSGVSFKNDTGGSINATGTGTFDVSNYEQGAGTTTGPNPVQIPCGTVKFTGNGAAKVMGYGGFSLNGELQANQALTVNAQSNNTNVTLASNFTNKGAITLSCFAAVPPASGCNGGDGATGVGFNVNDKDFVNAGTFNVAAASGTGSSLSANTEGTVTNTGTLQFDQSARLGGPVTNKGTFNIANGKIVNSAGSSCGDGADFVKNDTGGTINATGTGTLNVINYQQGAGTTSGTNPVQIPCGSLKYVGNGASNVMAYGGFTLTGDIQPGQALTVNAQSNNTNVTLGGDVTNNGSITLSCFAGVPPASGCNGGDANTGVGFNVNNKKFVNAGTFTVAAASGTGAGLGASTPGTITNTGTIQFDQSAYIGGPVTNKGKINIADGKTATSSGSSCGDTGGSVKNDTGGQINATGTGALSVLNYDQGNGTTSGTTPVVIPCGSLKYSGTGASTVQVNGNGTPMTGNVAAGQTLRLVGGISGAAFTNAGTIVLDQSATNPTINTGTVTNTGRIEVSGPSANAANITGGQLEQTGAGAETVVPAGTRLNPGAPIQLKAGSIRGGGTIGGSIVNEGGVVKPGESPGTMTLSGGSYVQGSGGTLEIEVDGTGAGQFDRLAVSGNATIAGTVALVPSAGFVSSSAIGDSVDFLSYGGTRSGEFGTTTTTPSLACPKQLTVGYDDTAKKASATVSSTGATCGGGGGQPPAPSPAETVLKTKPKGKIKTKKSKVKVKFAFSSDVAGATFECKLDKGAYAPCTSPKTYSVKKGKHTFSVRAIGSGGTDASPATFKFKVVKKKPKPQK